MANIVLKDKNGANIVYKNVDYVSFQTLEGGTVRFNERAADIINVTELPTEDINDNAIYRLTTRGDDGKTIVEFYAHENSGDWIEVAEGAKMSDLVVTENGEYSPVEAEDGFAKVTVNIDTFTDVEEFPTENIDQEAIYRVVRQDEETGATYTTYGIFDADDTKTVLEYNAEEGWVECGGRANLTELVATANGVYDNPQIIVEPNIAPGSTIQFKKNITINDIPVEYHNISNPADNMFYAGANTIGLFMVQQGGVAIETMHTIDGTLGNTDYIQLYVDEVAAGLLGASIGITAAGWYKGPSEADLAPIDAPECIIIEDSVEENELALLTQFSFLFGSISPADGWNKVTVNIPNADTIVEVDALPTSGVESDKIYKKVDRTEKYTIMAKFGESYIDVIAFGSALSGMTYTATFVDTSPETFIPSTETEKYLYCVLSTGEVLCSEDGTTTGASNGLLTFNPSNFLGVIEDFDSVPEFNGSGTPYYFLKSYDEFVTYGLPNNGTDKQYFEFNEDTNTWYELDSGDMLMERVDELPAENVNDNKVYCVKNEIEAMTEMYIKQGTLAMTMSEYLELMASMMSATTAIKYYVVDELPASPTVSILDQEGLNVDLHIYILASTGEPYVSTDGTACVFFGESGMLFTGEYKGQIADVSEVTEDGYYTIMRDASVSYTYGIPNDGNNKSIMVYRNGSWVRFVEETPATEPEEPTDPEATT